MSRIRTFVALELTDQVRERALQLIERLRASEPNFKWVAPGSLHLTLNFLGDVDERYVNEACQAVAAVAGATTSFQAAYAGVGAFPNPNRPRTVWIGVEQGHDEVFELQSQLADRLAPLGFPKETRKYQPHVTVGRARRGGRQPGQLAEAVQREAGFRAGQVDVAEVTVFSSHLEPTGPVYEVLSRTRWAATCKTQANTIP